MRNPSPTRICLCAIHPVKNRLQKQFQAVALARGGRGSHATESTRAALLLPPPRQNYVFCSTESRHESPVSVTPSRTNSSTSML